MKDISIVVPIYNAEKYLKKCIDSIVGQTKKELEIILINDGSTDNSHDIISSYLNDKRIVYIKNKNKGIGKTRNEGIKKATGKYLLFVDSDDYLRIDACELLYKKAVKEKSDIVIYDSITIKSSKEEKSIIPSFTKTSLKKNPSLLNKVNLAPWNKLYKTSLIKNEKITFVENLKYEDAPFVVEALDKAKSISKLDECLYYYLVHAGSETTIRNEKTFDIFSIVELIRVYCGDKDYLKEECDFLIVRILTNYNIQQRYQSDSKVAKRFLEMSFSYLEKHVPDYQLNKYYQNRSKFKKIIEKNKRLTSLYCNVYRKLHR